MTKEEEYILKVFPLVKQIQDDGIRNKVIKAWLIMWKESGYRTLEEAPMRGPAQDTLVKHTNAVTNGAFTLATQFQQEYGLPVNLDVLLAGAILHDIDKLVIYERKGNTVDYSALGKMYPHGSYGGHVALDVGLPMEVVSLIITHSQPCTWEPASVEGNLIHHADYAKIDSVRLALGLERSFK
ncbi:HD domain-containing protein [Chloroflexota bacterium]